jgi:hypothetical protein
MRAGAILVFVAVMLAGIAGANAAEIFRRGPVVCTSQSPKATAMTVGECSFEKSPGGGHYTGSCDGRLSLDGRTLPFIASAEATRIDYVYPDNDTPFTFSYRGVDCQVVSPRLKTVQNCRVTNGGLRKQCLVCAVTGGKVCFEVRLDVRIKGKARVASE